MYRAGECGGGRALGCADGQEFIERGAGEYASPAQFHRRDAVLSHVLFQECWADTYVSGRLREP